MEKNNKYRIDRKKKYLQVTLPDAIGMEESDSLFIEISEHIKAQNEMLVIDLVDTTMIYSSGFGLLIRLRKFISENNGNMSIVNVTRKINNFFTEFNLEKVFKIYSTDVEFELENDEIWKEEQRAIVTPFIFIAQKEAGVFRITISGNLSAINDISSLLNFEPENGIVYYLFNFTDLETIDTYGAQICNDLVGKISKSDGECLFFGVSSFAESLLGLFSNLKNIIIYESEGEALSSILA